MTAPATAPASRVRWGLMGLAGVAALVSLALPWTRYVSPGQYIPTTEIVTVIDYEGYETVEMRPGLSTFVPGSLYLLEGFDTSIRVLAPLVALTLVWALRRGRRTVARVALLVALIAPGLSGNWTANGSILWTIAVAIAAVGSGVVPLPRRRVAAPGRGGPSTA